jgi:hypothetical protein
MLDKHTLRSVLLFVLLLGIARADVSLELKGIRHRNETSQASMSKVSMAGGLEFFIDGKGMDDMPVIN